MQSDNKNATVKNIRSSNRLTGLYMLNFLTLQPKNLLFEALLSLDDLIG
jgi:hypothetical protein